MEKKILLLIPLCFFALIISSCADGAKAKKEQAIDARTAINKAKLFIAQQGYTDKKVDPAVTEVKFEKGEFASDPADILELRYNTLQKEAVGARVYGPERSWAVGFQHMEKENNIARVVAMDSMGINLVMQPQNVTVSWLLGQEAPPVKVEEKDVK